MNQSGLRTCRCGSILHYNRPAYLNLSRSIHGKKFLKPEVGGIPGFSSGKSGS